MGPDKKGSAIWDVLKRCTSPLVTPTSRLPVTPHSRPLVVLSLCRPLVVSSRRLALVSPLVAPSSCPLVVLSLPTSLAAPATMTVVVPRRPERQTLSSGWALPSHHRCPHHRPGCCFLPSNLVPVAIALRFVARHPRPPLLPSPSPSPFSSQAPIAS